MTVPVAQVQAVVPGTWAAVVQAYHAAYRAAVLAAAYQAAVQAQPVA